MIFCTLGGSITLHSVAAFHCTGWQHSAALGGGHRAYLSAVEDAFAMDVDYAPLEKIYGASSERRFTGLTIILSNKVENHAAAVALHFIHYNFARIHKTLRITPAMAAGISDHV
jgi:hypothetical protein